MSRLKNRFKIPETKDIDLFLFRFYLVGSIGFLFPPLRRWFIPLIPLSLLLSFSIILWREPQFLGIRSGKRYLIYLLITYFATFLIEMAGVNTGLLFGEYRYGNGLGWKIWGTPLLIGINWIVLLMGSAQLSLLFLNKYCRVGNAKYQGFLRVVSSSLLMVIYDLILERIAPLMHMWSWEGGQISLRNYLMWFLISILFQTYYVRASLVQRSNVSAWIFILQFFFFLIIYLGTRFI